MATSVPEPQWQLACDAIAAAESIVAVSHFAPDGDAVGSLLGLTAYLESQGKQVSAVIDGGVPPELAFVPRSETVLPCLDSGQFDLMIALDSSDVERTGKAGAYGLKNSGLVINLDHHPTNTGYGDIHLVVPQAVAAAEIVFDLLTYLGWRIQRDAAIALLTGLITDTHGFRISATSSRTLEIAQSLMSCGAPLAEIMAQTLNRRAFAEVALWRRVLRSVELDQGLIHACVTADDIAEAGLEKMTDGGLVSYLVNVDEARVSIVFKELPDQRVEVAFRAKPGNDVASLALKLGGGGHTLASGCTIRGSLEDARRIVLPLAHQVVSEGAGPLE